MLQYSQSPIQNYTTLFEDNLIKKTIKCKNDQKLIIFDKKGVKWQCQILKQHTNF